MGKKSTSAEEIKGSVHGFVKKHGRVPAVTDFHGSEELFDLSVVRTYFFGASNARTYFNLMRCCRLEPIKPRCGERKYWTADEVIETARKLHHELGRPLAPVDFRRNHLRRAELHLPRLHTVRKIFDGQGDTEVFRRIMEKARLPAARIKSRPGESALERNQRQKAEQYWRGHNRWTIALAVRRVKAFVARLGRSPSPQDFNIRLFREGHGFHSGLPTLERVRQLFGVERQAEAYDRLMERAKLPTARRPMPFPRKWSLQSIFDECLRFRVLIGRYPSHSDFETRRFRERFGECEIRLPSIKIVALHLGVKSDREAYRLLLEKLNAL